MHFLIVTNNKKKKLLNNKKKKKIFKYLKNIKIFDQLKKEIKKNILTYKIV